jgi:hypothetical protein
MVLGLSFLGYFGVIVGQYLIDYPLVILPILGLVIYWSFRFIKIPEPIRLLFLILAVLIPFISLKATMLGSLVLTALLLNLIIALVVIRVAFFIFPLTTQEGIIIEKKKPTAYKNINLDKLAFNGLLVVFPIVFMFYIFNASIVVLTLVFAVLLSFHPFIYQSKKGSALLVANVLGGLAGLFTMLVLVAAIVQLPVTLVVIPAIALVFSTTDNTTHAIIFTVYILIVSLLDNFLKPILLSKGLQTPTIIIFIGAIGGVLLHGIIGLFVGTVVLALAHRFYLHWVNSTEEV